MEVNNGKTVVFKGEQFSRNIGGIDYDACDQIVLLLYRGSQNDAPVVWVKVATDDYPDANLLELSGNDQYPIRVFLSEEITRNLNAGTYSMEAKRVISGIHAPILKSSKEFFTIKESRIK